MIHFFQGNSERSKHLCDLEIEWIENKNTGGGTKIKHLFQGHYVRSNHWFDPDIKWVE